MRCEKCCTETDFLAILPLSQPDGRLNTLVCWDCCQKSSVYCRNHQRPHMGFADGTSACVRCIEDSVEITRHRCNDLLLDKLKRALPQIEWEILCQQARRAAALSWRNQSAIIRQFLAAKMLRHHLTWEQVIDRLIAEQSVRFLFT